MVNVLRAFSSKRFAIAAIAAAIGAGTFVSAVPATAATNSSPSTGSPTSTPGSPTPPSVTATVTTEGRGAVSVPVGATTTPGLAVAYVASTGVSSGQMHSVSGGGLTWTRATWINALGADAEIWFAPTNGGAFTVATTTPDPSSYSQLTVVTYAGADGLGAVHVGAGAGPLRVSLRPVRSGSLIAGVGATPASSGRRSAGPDQSLTNDVTPAGAGEFFDQHYDRPTTAGATITLSDSAADTPWVFAAVEIRSIVQCVTRSDTVLEYGVTLTLTIGACTTPTQILSTTGSYSYTVGRNETVDYSQINHGVAYPGPGVGYGSSVTIHYFSEDLGFIVGRIAVLNAFIQPNGVITFNELTGG